MINYTLTLEDLTKSFGRRLIFKNINHQFSSGNVYGLAGSNGSGKSTLAKIMSYLLSPTSGKVIHRLEEVEITNEKLHNHLGFVSPYLVLYDEFSAEENLKHFLNIRGLEYNKEITDNLFNNFSLYERKNDLLKGYSSGMKQRMKFIFSLVHDPELLIFDEPTSNLDISGKNTVYKMIKQEAKSKLVIVASNEESDLELCNIIIQVEDFKL